MTTWLKRGRPSAIAREAALLAACRHPRLVAARGTWREGGAGVLALERIDGPDLAAVLDACAARGAAIAPGHALALIDDVLAALEHLHARGVVHRDVAPANVVVGPGGRATLIDLGGASRVGERAVAGRAAYLAPEAVAGAGDARVDLFAVAALAHELVTGAPWSLDAPSACGAPAPRAVDELVRRGLAPRAADRWPSAAAMRAAIAAIVRDDGLAAEGPRSIPVRRKRDPKKPRSWAVGTRPLRDVDEDRIAGGEA